MKKDGLGISMMRDRIWCTALFMPVKSKPYDQCVADHRFYNNYGTNILFKYRFTIVRKLKKS